MELATLRDKIEQTVKSGKKKIYFALQGSAREEEGEFQTRPLYEV